MVTLIVKARDPAIKANRESTCRLVLDRYQVGQAGTKLLCFVDDFDCEELKRRVGKASLWHICAAPRLLHHVGRPTRP